MGAASARVQSPGTSTVCAEIINNSGIPHFWYEQSGPDGERQDVLVLRGTFDFSTGGAPMTLAAEQHPIVYGDVTDGPSPGDLMRSVVVNDGDLVPYKPFTDILVTGNAIAPDGKAAKEWTAGIRVGKIEKAVRLHGPRELRKSTFGWSMGKATPTKSVALDYRLAFGGCLDIPAELTADVEADWVKFAQNPAGCGWLPEATSYGKLPKAARAHVEQRVQAQTILAAPQIEDVLKPVRTPYSTVAPAGMTAIARWWAPRVGLQGTYDEEWRRTRYPLLPKNFSAKYFQCASAGLLASPHLVGNETVTMVGLLPRRHETQLPCWQILVGVTRASGDISFYFALLDTVRFNLATQQASLVWRVPFGYEDPVIEVAIGSILRKSESARMP